MTAAGSRAVPGDERGAAAPEAAPVSVRNRRTALGLLAWVALLVLVSVAVAWVRN
jgi:hypothetical protein